MPDASAIVLAVGAATIAVMGLLVVQRASSALSGTSFAGLILVAGAYVMYYAAIHLGSELQVNASLAFVVLIHSAIVKGFRRGPTSIQSWIGSGIVLGGVLVLIFSVSTIIYTLNISIDACIAFFTICGVLLFASTRIIFLGFRAREAKDVATTDRLMPLLLTVYPLCSSIFFTTSWVTWKLSMEVPNLSPLAALTGACILGHFVTLHAALRQFEVDVILPLITAMMIVMNLTASLAIFREADTLSTEQLVAQLLASIAILVGIVLIVKSDNSYRVVDENGETP
jgi:multidrug transporter EmrE-like cation transporter